MVSEIGLPFSLMSEAASYSMAMVVRYALGLSAENSNVTAIVNDSFAGLVGLATIRHLVNAGSSIKLYVIADPDRLSEDLQLQLGILKKFGVTVDLYIQESQIKQSLEAIQSSVGNSHNVIVGLFDLTNPQNNSLDSLIELLNESKTPVHCIDCPLGIDPDSGKAFDAPLYASSTLSLGSVFPGLFNGDTYVGRHYISDISVPKQLYLEFGSDLSILFHEQPVTQIFPNKIQDSDGN